MRSRSTPIRHITGLVVSVLVLVGLLVGSLSALAQEAPSATPDQNLTWSVRPVPTDTDPERPNYVYDVEAGVTIRDAIRIRNYGNTPLPLVIYASDGRTTPTGALDLLPAGAQSVGVGLWITFEHNQVVVPEQGHIDVPFTIAVPAIAEAGDHTGGVVTSLISPVVDAAQPVVVDRRLGSRVHVRVAGDLVPGLAVDELEAVYTPNPNPFAPGSLAVTYTVTNIGNVRVGAAQRLTAAGWLGLPGREATLEPMPELLPGNSLTFTVTLDGVWPTFKTPTTISLTPVPAREGDTFTGPVAEASTEVTTVPWPQLAVLLVVVGIPLWIRIGKVRRLRREQESVRQAVQTALAVQEALKAANATPAPPATPETPPSPPTE